MMKKIDEMCSTGWHFRIQEHYKNLVYSFSHFSAQEGLMAIILSVLAIKIKVEKVSILLKIPIWEHFCHLFYVIKWDEKRKLEKNGHK